MAEAIQIPESTSREVIYEALIPQLRSLIEDEKDLIANMANVAAVLKEALGFFWVGFYRVEQDALVLGPFQGPLACTRIERGKGVCGTCLEQGQAIIVPDVEKFPGHIACSSSSRSEIVIPGLNQDGEVIYVLDIDSDKLNDFSEIDELYLTKVLKILAEGN